MLKTILSIAGRPGLYKLVNRGHNMLIVQSLTDGKRTPAYARDKVIGLGDIAIYTETEDVPLWKVLQSVKEKANGEAVDLKAMGNTGIKEFFEAVLPEYDRDRVYASDMKKVLQWYNLLLQAGITDYRDEEAETPEEGQPAEGEAKDSDATAE